MDSSTLQGGAKPGIKVRTVLHVEQGETKKRRQYCTLGGPRGRGGRKSADSSTLQGGSEKVSTVLHFRKSVDSSTLCARGQKVLSVLHFRGERSPA